MYNPTNPNLARIAALRNTIFGEVMEYADRNACVSDLALSPQWGDDPAADIPQERLDYLGLLWDAAHLPFSELSARFEMSNAAFGRCFAIGRRTIGSWSDGSKKANLSYLLPLAEVLASICGEIDLSRIYQLGDYDEEKD